MGFTQVAGVTVHLLGLYAYCWFDAINFFDVHCLGASNVIQFALVKLDDLIQTLGNLVIDSSIKHLYGYYLR